MIRSSFILLRSLTGLSLAKRNLDLKYRKHSACKETN